MTAEPDFVPLTGFREYPVGEMKKRASDFRTMMERRRTVRQFSDRPVPRDVIEECIGAAGNAPSGAHLQPWSFVAVSDPEVKKKIREAAEAEEKEFYGGRAPKEWLEALAPLGTDEHKPYLETAPWVIGIFVQRYGETATGRMKHYYAVESVGIATGVLITAIHNAGLVSLTHTPSPMGFIAEVLSRPANEKTFMLVVVGYPGEDARVPNISRKPLADFVSFI